MLNDPVGAPPPPDVASAGLLVAVSAPESLALGPLALDSFALGSPALPAAVSPADEPVAAADEVLVESVEDPEQEASSNVAAARIPTAAVRRPRRLLILGTVVIMGRLLDD